MASIQDISSRIIRMTMKRREFIGRMAAGSAVLSMPAFLSGCGIQQATSVADATPENPFIWQN
jgi:hypothetical protein